MSLSPEIAARLALALTATMSKSEGQPIKTDSQAVGNPAVIYEASFDQCPDGFDKVLDANIVAESPGKINVCWNRDNRVMTVTGLKPVEKVEITQSYCSPESTSCLAPIAESNKGNPDFEGRTADGSLRFGGGDDLTLLKIPVDGDLSGIKFGVSEKKHSLAWRDLGLILTAGLMVTGWFIARMLTKKSKQDTYTMNVASLETLINQKYEDLRKVCLQDIASKSNLRELASRSRQSKVSEVPTVPNEEKGLMEIEPGKFAGLIIKNSQLIQENRRLRRELDGWIEVAYSLKERTEQAEATLTQIKRIPQEGFTKGPTIDGQFVRLE